MATATRPPEWLSVMDSIKASRAEHPESWAQLSGCPSLIVYTDGSAPERNPGGVTGFAAVVIDEARKARLELSGHIPARVQDPPTSNNRAEIAGLLATLEALRVLLGEEQASLESFTIWCDSQYVVKCATGVYKRHKNRDLWSVYDGLRSQLKRLSWPDLDLRWTRAHVGIELNEAADQLAKAAALGQSVAAPVEVEDADYTLTLSKGRYLLETRSGRSSTGELDKPTSHADVTEYLALKNALSELLDRIESADREADEFTLLIRSARELVVKQLRGDYKVRSQKLKPLYERVRSLADEFAGLRFEQISKEEAEDQLWLDT